MQRIEGDLIALGRSGRFDVIVHGCNCCHAMGAGIARAIAETFPQALAADRATEHGTRAKLGTISHSVANGLDGHKLVIANAYTQYHYAGDAPLVEYDALQAAFEAVAAQFPGARVGYPLLGAGLAGGDWEEIAPRIEAALTGHDHALVVLPN